MTSASAPALRNTGAVMAGLLLVVVLSTGTDLLMHSNGIFPAMGQPMAAGLWLLALGYRFAFSFAGGWLTAKWAFEPKMRSVLILTGIGFGLGMLGVMASLGKGAAFGPIWYPVGVAVTGPLASWWGGKRLVERQQR